MEHTGDCYETSIEGLTFLICTQPVQEDATGRSTGEWHAWSFFAYDRSLAIFPADAVPSGITAQESIAGEFGSTEDEARRAVEDKLRKVIQTKNLDGTGFYSPPGGFIYPQELPPTD
jgi:hypothetical protein